MKLKLTAILALCSMLVSGIAGAADLDRYTINDISESDIELVLEGTPDGTQKDDIITIQLLKQGVLSDGINTGTLTSADITDNFVLITQLLAGDGGSYRVTADMSDEEPGFYWVRVNGKDVMEVYYASKENRETAIASIKKYCTVGNVYEENGEEITVTEASAVDYLKINFDLSNDRSIWVNYFGISDELIFEVTEDGMFTVFLSMVSELTIDNIREKLTDAAYITAVNENKLNIVDYADAFKLEDEYVAAYRDMIESDSEFMSVYFVGKGYKTKAKISEKFNDAVLEEWCVNFKSWEDPKDLIESFGEKIGIEMDAYGDLKEGQPSKLYVYLAGIEKYDDIKDFVEKTNEKIDELLNSKDTNKNSGGSGDGGGAVGSGMLVTPSIGATENVPQASEENTQSSPSKSFADMTGFDWAIESVEALAEKGIVSGTGDGRYEPERNVTREEMIVMILRAFDVKIGEAVSEFTDAAADGWYTRYLAVAKALGFVSGKPDGSFGVGEAVTRQDAAVMAYNIAKANGIEFASETGEVFADDTDVADYAREAVYALKNAKIINGKGEGMFAPIANCSRAEAAKIIYTLIK